MRGGVLVQARANESIGSGIEVTGDLQKGMTGIK
jgi:hypothetical protein